MELKQALLRMERHERTAQAYRHAMSVLQCDGQTAAPPASA